MSHARVHAAVAADQDVVRSCSDPTRCACMSSCTDGSARELRLAAVDRHRHAHAADVDAIRVVRIDADLAEVHRPRIVRVHRRHVAPPSSDAIEPPLASPPPAPPPLPRPTAARATAPRRRRPHHRRRAPPPPAAFALQSSRRRCSRCGDRRRGRCGRAIRPAGTPAVSRVHVSPPSVDFQMPLPGPPPFMQHCDAPALIRRRVQRSGDRSPTSRGRSRPCRRRPSAPASTWRRRRSSCRRRDRRPVRRAARRRDEHDVVVLRIDHDAADVLRLARGP